MFRAAAIATLLAIAGPMVPLHAGHHGADGCAMVHDRCERTAAFSCCVAGARSQDDPALTSARTIVTHAKQLVTHVATALWLPTSMPGAAVDVAAPPHVPPRGQRLAQLSVLLI